MSRWLRAWAPALGWAALIYLVSDQPSLGVDLSDGRDTLAHFAAYSIFGLTLGHARAHTGLPIPLLAGIGYLFALSDELHQSFVPGRSAEFGDWVADALGVLAGLYLHQLWRARRARAPLRPRGFER